MLFARALSGVGVVGVLAGGRKAVLETVCPHKHLAEDPDEARRVIGWFGFHICIFRQCSECRIHRLKAKIEAANESVLREDKTVNWHVWESVKKVMKKGDKVKEVNRTEKVAKSGSLRKLFDLYLHALDKLASHLFFSTWQFFQMIL